MHAPDSLHYRETPRGIPSTSREVQYLPITGDKFSPLSNREITFNLSGEEFVNFRNSHLRLTINNIAGAANTLLMDYCPPIERVIVRSGGNEVMKCDQYNRYFASRLYGTKGPSQVRNGMSECNFNNTIKQVGTTFVNSPCLDGLIYPNQNNTLTGAVPVGTAAAPGTSVVCYPLWGGLFDCKNLIPLPLLSSTPLEITFTLAANDRVGVTATAAAGGAVAATSYYVTNPALVCDCAILDAEFTHSLREHLLGGNSLAMHAENYDVERKEVGQVGQHEVMLPSKRNNVKAVLSNCMRAASYPSSVNNVFKTGACERGIGQIQYACGHRLYPNIPHQIGVAGTLTRTPFIAICKKIWDDGSSQRDHDTCYGAENFLGSNATLGPGQAASGAALYVPTFSVGHRMSAFEQHELEGSGLNSADNGVHLIAKFSTTRANLVTYHFVIYDETYYVLPDGTMQSRG